MVKRIGGGKAAAKHVEFELVAYNEDDEKTFAFTAAVRNLPAELVHLAAKAETEPSKAARPLIRLLGKLMSNKDGVPSSWSPLELDDDDPGVPEGGKAIDYYRDHEGHVRAFSDTETLEWLQNIDNGSSRRRWQHLMEVDDEAVVELEDLIAVAEYLVAEGSDRPTARRG